MSSWSASHAASSWSNDRARSARSSDAGRHAVLFGAACVVPGGMKPTDLTGRRTPEQPDVGVGLVDHMGNNAATRVARKQARRSQILIGQWFDLRNEASMDYPAGADEIVWSHR